MAQDPIQSIQGTEDVLPAQWQRWRALYETGRRLFALYGYGEIRTPVFEDTRLFVKGTGETTDIVQKEMYTIPTGDGRGLTLRPEGTPPVIRSYLEHNLHKQETFQKLYYVGPMFRHERPQKGRLRQFHQLGVEAIGSGSPLLDAETIILAVEVFRGIGLEQFGVFLNSMGCVECRPGLRAEMRERLTARLDELCEDCQRRLERNVFRVLDCKNAGCRRVTAELPPLTDGLCAACGDHHEQVKAALADGGVEYEEDPHLVRGLDYYTRTVYEMRHGALGARDEICGGGRYDGLAELLGGPSLPCVGFAIGAEATILAMEGELGPPPESTPPPEVYVVCFADEARGACFGLVQELRASGVAAETDFEGRSPKSQMRVADRLGAPLCLLLGPEEVAQGEVTVRDMADSRQWRVPRQQAVQEVTARISGGGPKG
ncbi:MAG: histidine--tRNA ligase [Planctomycetota bacterium]|jgi:histidyl-tRNA synthetase